MVLRRGYFYEIGSRFSGPIHLSFLFLTQWLGVLILAVLLWKMQQFIVDPQPLLEGIVVDPHGWNSVNYKV
jgi:hypothetical protein